MTTLTAHILDVDFTVNTTLTGWVAGTAGWTHPVRGAGQGTITLRNDHANWSTLYPDPDDATTHRKMVRFSLDGTAVFTFVVQDAQPTLHAVDGEHVETTTFTGPGALATLGYNGLDSATVDSDAADGKLRVGWVTSDFDDSSWTEPTSLQFVVNGLPEATDFPDQAAEFVGATVASGNPTYLRRYLDLSARPTKQGVTARGYFVGKGTWRAYFDGQLVATGEPFEVVSVNLGALGSTGHQVAMYSDVGSVGFTLVKVDADGQDDGVLYRSFTTGVRTGDPDSCVGLEDGSVPAKVTAGQAWLALQTPAQTRGALAGVTTSVTAALDSDAASWTNSLELVSYDNGQQLGDILIGMTQQFGVGVQMSPSGEVLIYDQHGTDLSGTVQLAAGQADGQLVESGSQVRAPKANAVLASTSGGKAWSPSSTGVPSGEAGRFETAATFGRAETTAEVATAVTTLLTELGATVVMTFGTLGPSGEDPYGTWTVGDRIGLVDEPGGSMQPFTVVQITAAEDVAGNIEFVADAVRR